MKIIVHSLVGDTGIRTSLGIDDYSYYFVRHFFAEALGRFAEVVVVSDPRVEVDPIYDQARANGEPCLFLSFAPPQKTVLGLRCPVVPVFAWEFSTVPNEVWDGDIRNDWRAVFGLSRGAIALSSYTVRIVKAAMGEGFPIVAIPAPVFERFQQEHGRAVSDSASLRIAGAVLDTDLVAAFRSAPVWPRDPPVPLLTPGPLPIGTADAETMPAPSMMDAGVAVAVPCPVGKAAADASTIRIGWRRRLQITRHLGLDWYRLAVRDLLPAPLRRANALAGRTMHRLHRRLRPAQSGPMRTGDLLPDVSPDESAVPQPPPGAALPAPQAPVVPVVHVALHGVVFVSMFSPRDGRKNWNDIVTAFCWAMRDVSDATLVLKIVATDHAYERALRQLLGELAPMRCRVVVLHGFLEVPDYRALITAASFYVNASHCEGLCLPMLEFMSAGTPTIAPGHTAFEDYVSPANSFVIPSDPENTVWPADGRDLFRTTRFRIDWHTLMLNYREAYRVATREPERYAAMSCDARETMARFCGIEPVTQALRGFLVGHPDAGLERAA